MGRTRVGHGAIFVALKYRVLFSFLSLLPLATAVRADQPEGLRLVQTIPLPTSAIFDHLAVDRIHRRAYLTASANRALYVVDLKAGSAKQISSNSPELIVGGLLLERTNKRKVSYSCVTAYQFHGPGCYRDADLQSKYGIIVWP